MSEGTARGALDASIASAAARDLPLAASILREAVRIPADHVDRPARRRWRSALRHQQPRGPAPAVPARRLVEAGGRHNEDDVGFDAFGNL